MKTRELIQLLLEADPEGNTDVVVGNHAVYAVDREPGYYDGAFQRLIEDPAQKPYYAVCGAEIHRDEAKVRLSTLSIRDALLNDPELPVTVFACENSEQAVQEKQYHERVAKWRSEARECHISVEMSLFAQWAKQRGLDRERAEAFFVSAGLSPDDAMPDDIRTQVVEKASPHPGQPPYTVYPSWFDRRSQQWDREVKIDSNGTWRLVR